MKNNPPTIAGVRVGEDDNGPAESAAPSAGRGTAGWLTGAAALALLVNLGAGMLFFVEQAAASERTELRAETEARYLAERARLDALIEEIAAKEAERQEEYNRRDRALAEVAAARETLSSLSEARMSAESTIRDAAHARSSLEAVEEAARVAKEAADLAEARSDTAVANMRAAEAAEQRLSGRVRELNGQLGTLEDRHSDAVSLQTKISEREARIGELDSEIAALESRRQGLRTDFDNDQEQAVKARRAEATLKAKQDEVDEREKRLLQLVIEVGRLESSTTALEEKKATLGAKNKSLEATRMSLTQKLAEDVAAKEADLLVLTQQIEQKKAELEAAQ